MAEATATRDRTVAALQALQAKAKAREEEAARLEAQRLEQARIAAEQAERERVLQEQQAELQRQLAAVEAARREQEAREQAAHAAREAEELRQRAAAEEQERQRTAAAEDKQRRLEAPAQPAPAGQGSAAAPAPAVVHQFPAQVAAPAGPASQPTLGIGRICELLRIGTLRQADLKALGVEPGAVVKGSPLYTREQVAHALSVWRAHILTVEQELLAGQQEAA